MTVISAVIGKDIMAISTDSYKTKYIKSSDIYEVVEFKRPKILPVRKFHCAISFWGLVDYGGWSLEKFLKYLVRISPDNLSLQEFAQYIADGLRTEIDRIIPGNKRTKGFGLHVTGFEQYKNMMIPELFLISNFDGIEYKKIKDILFWPTEKSPVTILP